MNQKAPPVVQPPVPARRSRWPYWVVVPFCGFTYAAYCFWFLAEAWGRRGEPKPGWFDAAFALAYPGMFFPIPIVGPLVLGAGVGYLLVRVTQSLRR